MFSILILFLDHADKDYLVANLLPSEELLLETMPEKQLLLLLHKQCLKNNYYYYYINNVENEVLWE